MAVGFFVGKSWKDRSCSTWGGGFHDEAIQDLLLPFFKAGGKCVDPWDGGVFQGPKLIELRQNLLTISKELESRSQNLDLSHDDLERYYTRGRAYGISLQTPREQSLSDLKCALELIEIALKEDLALFFLGD